jgi:hexosaminidase
MKNSILKCGGIIFFIVIMYSCHTKTPKDLTKESIIPKPSLVIPTNSSFELSASTVIYYEEGSEAVKSIGEYLSNVLGEVYDFNLKLIASGPSSAKNGISLMLSNNSNLGDEGYQLSIDENQITIASASPAGVFLGVQTLRQLIPVRSKTGETAASGSLEIATGTITDSPAYGYRGAMLDVSRHFFDVDDVKRYIDLLAAFKMNVLHLHLSDDQGWRIEIKSWPNLTAIGGSTQVGGGKGGFYTQEQYKDIVQYAASRFITIVPEIDMPGHTNAALASYGELNCDGKARELYTGTQVGFSTFCTSSETTYQFIDDVIRELSEITPGPYIHIGGDESHVTPLEDYIPFINRVQGIVAKYGKKVIGWDEIAHASLIENATVQFWAKADNATKGVEQGAQVLMSPATKTYLDMQYDSTTKLGLHWAAYIEVDEAYNWDPATLVPGINRENILGIESPLWTETITNMEEIEYMVFPRILCHAEIGWTKTSDRNWEDFRQRLGSLCKRLEAMEINYYPSAKVPWQ